MFKLSEHYDQLIGMIIRPPRFVYHVDDLGPKHFSLSGKDVKRTDFELINPRKLTLQCSHFEPLEDWGRPIPCVVYLHGNGGGRLDAIDTVRALLPCGISVLALDFAGSGLSEGEYVSLGYWEKDDVATVIHHLRSTGRVTTVGLWGRSMGAVTALLYAREDPSVAAMVLDSPFCSLQRIAEDLVCNVATLQRMPRLTRFGISIGLRAMRGSIKKRAKFDVKTLEILDLAKECFIPSLFVHGEMDTFVQPHHSEELYKRYGGDKNRILVEGDHNSIRPQFFMDSAVIFFTNALYNNQPPQPSPLSMTTTITTTTTATTAAATTAYITTPVTSFTTTTTSSSFDGGYMSDDVSAEEISLMIESMDSSTNRNNTDYDSNDRDSNSSNVTNISNISSKSTISGFSSCSNNSNNFPNSQFGSNNINSNNSFVSDSVSDHSVEDDFEDIDKGNNSNNNNNDNIIILKCDN